MACALELEVKDDSPHGEICLVEPENTAFLLVGRLTGTDPETVVLIRGHN